MHKYLPSWLRWGGRCNDIASTISSFVSVSHPPEQEDPEAQHIVSNLLRLHTELFLLSDLRPCDIINALFGELVEQCTRTVGESITTRVMSCPEIIQILPSIRSICAKAENHLESHWADLICGTDDESHDENSVYDRFVKFPYLDNYVALTRLELGAIQTVDTSPLHRIAFIGSGPLPMTSLQLCHTLPGNIEVLNVDHDSLAISQSKSLCARLGTWGKGMKFLCTEAGACDLREFGIVYLAALVGCGQEEKESFLIQIAANMRDGATLVIRSAHGLRKVLYAEFDPTTEVVRRCLDVQLVVHPYNNVVNSVIIGRVKQASVDSLGPV
ncbi:Nicotianamine synthase [Stipitochalara longipes BDJ]|nr:Nicotianamine synthase [Stipitochalara longipes BDJ]